MKITKRSLAEAGVFCDTLGKNKAGNYVLRRGFFYRHGCSAGKIANELKEKFPEVEIVDKGEHWTEFRGGQSVRQGSHWWVEFKIKEAENENV